MSNSPNPNSHKLPQSGWMQRLTTPRGLAILGGVSAVLLVAAIVIGVILYRQINPSQPQPSLPPSLAEMAEKYPELAEILNDPELDSVYKEFLITYQEKGWDAAVELAHKRGLVNKDDEVLLTLELDTTESGDLVNQLEGYGVRVATVSGKLIDIAVPLKLIEEAAKSENPGEWLGQLSSLEHVVRVRLPQPSVEEQWGVELESLDGINASTWQEAGFSGEGIKIAIVDSGFTGYQDLLGSDLPDEVITRSFYDGYPDVDNGVTVHGKGCAEIVYDIAPEATMYLVTASTQAETEQAIDWLISEGVQIISHSGSWMIGLMDGNGNGAKIADNAFAKGVLWVNSSGNYAYSHYYGKFADKDSDGWHEYSGDDEMMTYTPYGTAIIALSWAEGDQDYDLYLDDKNGNTVASSENAPTDGSFGEEYIYYEFSDNEPYYISVYNAGATKAVNFNLLISNGEVEYPVAEYSLATPADARNSLTVGAINWADNALEYYSSQGPSFDGRLKPELTAAAKVSTNAYGDGAFDGTSASAPHVAGAAALVMQANPGFSNQQVRDYLINHSIDEGSYGPDNEFGHGRLYLGEPGAEIAEIEEPTPVSPEVTETSPAAVKATATYSSTPGATPTRKATTTPKPSASSKEVDFFGLGLFACVGLPALLGLGGLAFVLGVVYINRRQKTASQAAYPPRWEQPSNYGSQPPDWQTPPPAYQSPPYSPPPYQPPSYPSPPPYRPPEPSPEEIPTKPCPMCGHRIPVNARFCTHCGKLILPKSEPAPLGPRGLPGHCPHCGFSLRSTSKFCPNCGKRV
ncbi:MAG: S8 family serine peptidase [Anaerolineales bacterium]|nr:S8 family serine peptidase [Anaerolineales bacterium]